MYKINKIPSLLVPMISPSIVNAHRWLNIFFCAIFSIMIYTVSSPISAANWWDASWSKCRNITIANTGSSTLNDFPYYISLGYDDMRFTFTTVKNQDA